MKSMLVLPVPRTVTSTFVVAAPSDGYDTTQTATIRTAGPNLVQVDIQVVRTAYVRPDSFYLDAGTPVAYVQRVHDSGRHLLVTVGGTPAWPAHPAHTSRGVANDLARASAGLLLDPLTGLIALPMTEPDTRKAGEPVLPLGRWAMGRFDADRERVVLTGMSRFGLSDMCADGVTADIAPDVIRLLTLVGSVVLNRFWAALEERPRTEVDISNPVLIDSNFGLLRDGDPELPQERSSRAYVQLVHSAPRQEKPHIQVTWPEGYGGSQSDWWRRTAKMLLPSIEQ